MCYERTIFVLLCALVVSIDSSKCPEVRKPHVTSCTIFYNCINLPEGGYVWAPAKCPEGLVFQPYLRICVLPGDAWACDDSATERVVLGHAPESPQLTDPSLTSYHGYEQDFASPTANPATDAAQLGNIRPLATAYPLIEIISAEDNKNTPPRDSMSQSPVQETENYTYEFFASQHRLRTRLNSASSVHDGKNDKLNWLRGIIDGILLYEDNEGTRQSCQLQQNNRRDVLEGNVLNYLVQSYVLGTRNPTRDKSRKRKNQSTTTRAWTGRIEEADDRNPTTPMNFHGQSAIDQLINGPESENNVIVIEGNLGEREYVTIEKYKLLSRRIKVRALDILACAKGVRLPNITDCTKYYTCDPETANVAQFACPATTAFNDYNRVCDLQRYKACSRRHGERLETTTQRVSSTVTMLAPNGTEIAEKNEPCRSTGKFVDAASDKHYYVCYSSQANPSKIESLRMTCPNDLIFCQDRRVCSTRKRCYDH